MRNTKSGSEITQHAGTPTEQKQLFAKRGNTIRATTTTKYKHYPIGQLPSVPSSSLNPHIMASRHKKYGGATHNKKDGLNLKGYRYDDVKLAKALKRHKENAFKTEKFKKKVNKDLSFIKGVVTMPNKSYNPNYAEIPVYNKSLKELNSSINAD